jgi:threonine/homoserine/homoserine lactone efflux protein
MLRPFLTLAALGVAGVVAWKLLWGLVLPVIAVVLGAVFLVLKIALVAFLVYLAYRMFQRLLERRPDTPA